MIRRIFAGAVLAIPGFLAESTQTVSGQEAGDIEQIEACLTSSSASSNSQLTRCIGQLSDACNVKEGAGSAAHCMMREAEAWAAIVGQRLSDLASKSKPDVAESVRSAQASWEKFREDQCDATGIFFDQYSGSASAQWAA